MENANFVSMEKKLNARRERFCQEYLLDLNAAKAAERAGFSPSTAKEQGCMLLKDPKVKARILELQAPVLKKLEITRERVLLEFARIGFSDIRELYDEDNNLRPIKELSDDAAAALAAVEADELFAAGLGGKMMQVGVTKKAKLHNKIAALEALGKHLGLFEADNKQKQPLAVLDLSGLAAADLAKLANG